MYTTAIHHKFLSHINWAVLSDEQMRKIWPFSLLNDEQMVATRWRLSTNQPVQFTKIFSLISTVNQLLSLVNHTQNPMRKRLVPGPKGSKRVMQDGAFSNGEIHGGKCHTSTLR